MINIFIINAAILLLQLPKSDSTKEFHYQLAGYIGRYIENPPDADSGGTCYHYTDLLKVEIGKFYKIDTVRLSDSAPLWLIAEFRKLEEKQRINYDKLRELAKKAKLKKCTLVFPFINESDDFPCGTGDNKSNIPEGFFRFKGQPLKGDIIFCEPIKIEWSTRYLYKQDN